MGSVFYTLTPSRLIKRSQMAILDWLGNHKQSITRTYHQDETRTARPARAKLSILDIVHKSLHSLEKVKP